MKGPKILLENEDHWRTRMGLVFAGKRVVFRGKDLFRDLKHTRWMELYLYGITGRQFDDRQIRLFEGMWTIGTSYPDPRIWNNRVAALAGTARSTATLAVSAATAVSEASVYGRRPDIRAIDFLKRSLVLCREGRDLISILKEELQRYRGIPGYARPLINDDERIVPMMALAGDLGYGDGLYVNHAFRIEEVLLSHRYRMKMNGAALGAALAADQGLSVEEYYRFMVPCFNGGILPCYIDAREHEEATLLPLRCSRVVNTGIQKRNWT